MDKINFKKLLEIVDGKWIQGECNAIIDSIEIDSRKIGENGLFIPIIGEKNNGHDYMHDVFQKGGKISLTQEMDRDFPDDMIIIKVESTFKSLQDLANYNRHRNKASVVAITGSSGKTTTKDLVDSVLSQKYKTLKTQGNFNNEFGIPQTLLGLDSNHEIAVIEMGMDYLGDIEKSIELVDPDIAVITNIGLAHIEILKNQENIFKAKKEILKTLSGENIALINGDDPYLRRLLKEENEFSVKSFAIRQKSDLVVSFYESTAKGLFIVIDNESYFFAYPGEHNLYNCLVAIWLGKYYGLTCTEIQKGLDAFKPSKNRMDIFNDQGIKFIDDSYNANPDAMRAALDVLDTLAEGEKIEGKKRRIAILGDMLEMGDYASQAHYEIGEYARNKVDILITVGEISIEINRGFKALEYNIHLKDIKETIDFVKEIAKVGDVILVKGSRGIHLDQLITAVKER